MVFPGLYLLGSIQRILKMAITVKNIVPSRFLPAAQTTIYRAINCKTVIDKFTATNTSIDPVVVSVNIVASGKIPEALNTIILNKSLQSYETYSFPDLVGQVLEPNDYISTVCSTEGVLSVTSSGREIT